MDWNANAFSLDNAVTLADLSRCAYANKDKLGEALRALGFHQSEYFEASETEGFIVPSDSAAAVVFRGTQTSKDWLTDAKFRMEDDPWGRVHRGFKGGLDVIWDRVRQLLGTRDNLWIAGHSLGGALAVLAAARFAQAGKKIRGVYTYGQPRVGDPKFASTFDQALGEKLFRFVNNNDVVPRVPFLLGRYRHCGQRRYFTVEGKLLDRVPYWSGILDRIRGRLGDLGRPGTEGIGDHNIARYIQLLASLASPVPR